MTKLPLITTATSGLALVLALWFLVGTWSNQGLQNSLQRQQEDIQARELTIQSQQQQLQSQQQQIDAGSQLANQLGPAIIRDLAALQVDNENSKIEALLTKYGITATPRAEDEPAKEEAP
jgi:uncharacterized membrane protein YhiD involved in acid resistance